jgi:hypothetical protein
MKFDRGPVAQTDRVQAASQSSCSATGGGSQTCRRSPLPWALLEAPTAAEGDVVDGGGCDSEAERGECGGVHLRWPLKMGRKKKN